VEATDARREGVVVKRYEITAYYEEPLGCTRVARKVVVVAPDQRAAVDVVLAAVAPFALAGHIVAVEITERDLIHAGVCHMGDPYIPLHWPLVNRPHDAPAPHAANGAGPTPAHGATNHTAHEANHNGAQVTTHITTHAAPPLVHQAPMDLAAVRRAYQPVVQ
jgi:hypothetical protein